MKRSLMSIATAVGCMFISQAAVSAQTAAVYHVPFSFNAGGVDLPSGQYAASHAVGAQSGILRSNRGKAILYLRGPNVGSETDKAHLTFNKYGNRYFLREVWDAGGARSNVRMSSQEREIVKGQQLAKATPPEVVLVAQR